MKKSNLKKKYPNIKKNKTFKFLWGYYRQAQAEYLSAIKRAGETEATYQRIKSDKSADAKLVKAWKKEVKRAKAGSKLHAALIKEARKHVKRWLRSYLALQEFNDLRPKLKKATAKNKTAKPAESKKAPAKKTKKKSSAKKKEATKAKPKTAAQAKPAAKKSTRATKPRTTNRAVAKAPTKKVVPVAKPKPPAKNLRPDNLKRVEGIGVKIEQLLKGAGITTFEALSKSQYETLRGLLDQAGPHYRASDPTTWPQQAKLAATGQWDELKLWQAELKGGRLKK